MKRVTVGLALLAALALPASAATPTSYNVFFAPRNAELTPDSSAIIASAAATIRHSRSGKVIISAGDPQYAEARFHTVQVALVADGVDATRIVRANLAATSIAYDALLANRVEIKLMRTGGYVQTALSL